MEIVDHSDDALGHFALFGFFGLSAQQRSRTAPGDLEEAALAQLKRMFGPDAARPVQTYLMDWSREPFTATEHDLGGSSGHPPYGEPALREMWFDGRLILASAESSDVHGGLVEGAVLAGERAASDLLSVLEKEGEVRGGEPVASTGSNNA
jgi:monoamine oxidase